MSDECLQLGDQFVAAAQTRCRRRSDRRAPTSADDRSASRHRRAGPERTARRTRRGPTDRGVPPASRVGERGRLPLIGFEPTLPPPRQRRPPEDRRRARIQRHAAGATTPRSGRHGPARADRGSARRDSAALAPDRRAVRRPATASRSSSRRQTVVPGASANRVSRARSFGDAISTMRPSTRISNRPSSTIVAVSTTPTSSAATVAERTPRPKHPGRPTAVRHGPNRHQTRRDHAASHGTSPDDQRLPRPRHRRLPGPRGDHRRTRPTRAAAARPHLSSSSATSADRSVSPSTSSACRWAAGWRWSATTRRDSSRCTTACRATAA